VFFDREGEIEGRLSLFVFLLQLTQAFHLIKPGPKDAYLPRYSMDAMPDQKNKILGRFEVIGKRPGVAKFLLRLHSVG
jgi:hypothetical protein